MDRDRTSALCYFLRYLSGNPDGDSAARAMVLGALAPVGIIAGQIYAASTTDTLEMVGNYGFSEDSAGNYRTLPTHMPLPVCDAFTAMTPVTVAPERLRIDYPLLDAEPGLIDGTSLAASQGNIICAPIVYSGQAVGSVALVQETPVDWDSSHWQYLDGTTSAVGLWMSNQRNVLIERWRRAAPVAHREVRISERQRHILELVGLDMTNGQIARELGYSVPTIKKDLQQIMRVLGTQDRRNTAGRAREIGLLPERRRGE